MKKLSTATAHGIDKLQTHQLTIGLDLGDRSSYYCVLDEAGNIVLEEKVATTPKALGTRFAAMPRSRIALETGMHSPWVSRLLSGLGHETIVAHARNVRAACYGSTVEQWKEFDRNWNEFRRDAGFEVFHMTDFAASRRAFQGWDDTKKRRVLCRACNLINTRVKVGYAAAVPKRVYDTVISRGGNLRPLCGNFHYTFAVRQCATRIADWRRQHYKTASMKYIFDQMGSNQGKGEIMAVMDAAISKSKKEGKLTGVPPLTGYSFEDKTVVLPLQAADIFAWTVLQQMHKRLSKRSLDWVAELAWEQLGAFSGPLEATFFTEPQLVQWAEDYVDNLIKHFEKKSALSRHQ